MMLTTEVDWNDALQDADVRQMAAWALGQIEDSTAVRSLTPLLKGS